MSDEFYRVVDDARACAVKGVERERAVRLYCTHAYRGGSWALQVRAPQGLESGGDGKAFFVSTASIGREDMIALRDMIDDELRRVAEQ